MEKEIIKLKQKIKQLEKTLQFVYVNNGICELCEKEGAKLIIDPYMWEIEGETIYRYACDKCIENIADEI